MQSTNVLGRNNIVSLDYSMDDRDISTRDFVHGNIARLVSLPPRISQK